MRVSPDTGGDTEPGTDVEDFEIAAVGTKRKVSGLVGSTSKYVQYFSCSTFILMCSQVEAVARS